MGEQDKRYFSMVVEGDTADIDIYGNIYSERWGSKPNDMNAWRLSRQLAELEGVTKINVNINSMGGEVAEGIAIYNALRRHPARITTRCDGMACSIASVIFMAGDDRIMYEPSMLMIHNASSYAFGTADEMRKVADDVEKITTMSKAAYMERVSISEDELSALMDAETWIDPSEALDWGFATVIEGRVNSGPSQSAMGALSELIRAGLDVRAAQKASDDQGSDDDQDDEQDDDPDDTDNGKSDSEDDDSDEAEQESCQSFFEAAFKH